MSGLLQPKKTIDYREHVQWGLVLWQLPDGTYLKDDQGRELSAGPCVIGNHKAEINMRHAVRSMGVKGGKPFWLPGFRKVSDNEWDDQMERLMDGKIPDAADLYRQSIGHEIVG